MVGRNFVYLLRKSKEQQGKVEERRPIRRDVPGAVHPKEGGEEFGGQSKALVAAAGPAGEGGVLLVVTARSDSCVRVELRSNAIART